MARRCGMEIAGLEKIGSCGCRRGCGRRLVAGFGKGEEFGLRRFFTKSAETGGGILPFKLGGKTMSGPTRISIGFEEAEMTDRRLGEIFQRDKAVQRVDRPAGLGLRIALPIERSLPAFGREGSPSFREPKLRPVVAVLVDESKIFSTGDETGSETEGSNVDGCRGISLSKAKSSVEEGSGVRPISVRPGAKSIHSSGGAMVVAGGWSRRVRCRPDGADW